LVKETTVDRQTTAGKPYIILATSKYSNPRTTHLSNESKYILPICKGGNMGGEATYKQAYVSLKSSTILYKFI
jgi:hypothetical protein